MKKFIDLPEVSRFFREVKKITGCNDKDIDMFLIHLNDPEEDFSESDSFKPF